MHNEFENFFLQFDEPVSSCFLALKSIILMQDKSITTAWKYRMPFFYLNGKMFCYIRLDKKTQKPYLGLVEGGKIEHPKLIKGDRSRMKIMLFDANEDLPIDDLNFVLKEAMKFYKY
jgi:hypothetical protein